MRYLCLITFRVIVVSIQRIVLGKDRLRQLSLDEQSGVLDHVFEKDLLGHVIGGHDVQADFTSVGAHGQPFEDEISPDAFLLLVDLLLVHVVLEYRTDLDALLDAQRENLQ